MIYRDLHPLEIQFEMSAREILDVILNRNRTLINIRGAIAEAHLKRRLEELRSRNIISEFEEFDRDGHPDFAVPYLGQRFLIECKNVEKEKPRRNAEALPITVDFQRTRNQKAGPEYRFYAPSEFHVLAACLWNRTAKWEFAYVATIDLPRHHLYPDRLSNHVSVPYNQGIVALPWSHNLIDILDRLAA